MYVVLNNIRSAHNVGSILRTADGIGAQKVYMCGFTPSPIKKNEKDRISLTKVSLGAEDYMDWEKSQSSTETIGSLQERGVEVFAIEQTEGAINLFEMESKSLDWQNTALVLGNEVEGLPEEVISECDGSIEIPMFGKKKSLNVSVAFGVAGFYIKSLVRN